MRGESKPLLSKVQQAQKQVRSLVPMISRFHEKAISRPFHVNKNNSVNRRHSKPLLGVSLPVAVIKKEWLGFSRFRWIPCPANGSFKMQILYFFSSERGNSLSANTDTNIMGLHWKFSYKLMENKVQDGVFALKNEIMRCGEICICKEFSTADVSLKRNPTKLESFAGAKGVFSSDILSWIFVWGEAQTMELSMLLLL